jgi:hypothetical protein
MGLGTYALTSIDEIKTDSCEERVAAVESRLAVCETRAGKQEASLRKAADFIAGGCR